MKPGEKLFDSDSESESAWEERRRAVAEGVAASLRERSTSEAPIPEGGLQLVPAHEWSTAYKAFASSDDVERYLQGEDPASPVEQGDQPMDVVREDPPEAEGDGMDVDDAPTEPPTASEGAGGKHLVQYTTRKCSLLVAI